MKPYNKHNYTGEENAILETCLDEVFNESPNEHEGLIAILEFQDNLAIMVRDIEGSNFDTKDTCTNYLKPFREKVDYCNNFINSWAGAVREEGDGINNAADTSAHTKEEIEGTIPYIKGIVKLRRNNQKLKLSAAKDWQPLILDVLNKVEKEGMTVSNAAHIVASNKERNWETLRNRYNKIYDKKGKKKNPD